MITKGDLNKAKTLPEVEALLLQFRTEDKPSHARIIEIEGEIDALRIEMRGLKKSVNAGIREDDILLKIGLLYAEAL